MKKYLLVSLLTLLTLSGCTNKGGNIVLSDTTDESAQQIGDAMASIDEAGGSSGQLALNQQIEKTFRRLSPRDLKPSLWNNFLIQPAFASGCFESDTFGSCSTNTIVRTFDGCSVGPATFDGTVTLTWGGTSSNCILQAIGDTIVREPNFSATGLRGATLAVSKTGTIGQKLEWISGTDDSRVFEFTNDGIRRVFTKASATLFDFTTKTTEAITVTGANRGSRVLSGGNLKVTNNKSDVVCNYTPTDVTWNTSACNCPVSGTWDGECSDGKITKLDITGCGTADFTVDGETGSVEFDRCIAQ